MSESFERATVGEIVATDFRAAGGRARRTTMTT